MARPDEYVTVNKFTNCCFSTARKKAKVKDLNITTESVTINGHSILITSGLCPFCGARFVVSHETPP